MADQELLLSSSPTPASANLIGHVLRYIVTPGLTSSSSKSHAHLLLSVSSLR